MVTDAKIDALVAQGWDWHAAYRHLQTIAHSRTMNAASPPLRQNEECDTNVR